MMGAIDDGDSDSRAPGVDSLLYIATGNSRRCHSIVKS